MKQWILFLLLFAAVVLGVVVPIMDNDAAHHAAMALVMSESGDYITLTDVVQNHIPYFDKPHFQFWLVAKSFDFFGVSTFVYKLSSLIFVLISIVSVYKLGQYLVPRRELGSSAAFILVSMAAFMLGSSVDIRMDAILSGAVALALWQGVVCIGGNGSGGYLRRVKIERFRFMPYLGLAAGLAMAFATKGLFGVVIVGVALLCYMISVQRIKWLISWQFLLVVGLFSVLISPVLYAYFVQFGWEGVRFILYEQVLYRTGGEMYGSASADDYFFFFHSLLWVILPWSFLFYIFAVRDIIKREIDSIFALTVIPSFVMMFVLSFSSFKLPHYLNPLFMLMALYVASRLLNLEPRTKMLRTVIIIQKIVVAIMVIFAAIINFYVMPIQSIALSIIYGAFLAWPLYMVFVPWRTVEKVIFVSVLTSALVWIGLNGNFYVELLKYQAGSEKGFEYVEQGVSPRDVAMYEHSDAAAFEICHQGMHPLVMREQLVDSSYVFEQTFLWITNEGYNDLVQDSVFMARGPRIVEQLSDFRITRLNRDFLTPSTREASLDTVYIIGFQK